MAQVPSNLIPTRVTQLPDAPVASPDGLLMFVYEGNSYKIRAGDLLQVSGVPTSTQVIAGTGLSGGGALTNNVTIDVAPNGISTALLAASGVTSGIYGNTSNIPVLTIDATGRVTAASTVAVAGGGGGGSGSVTSVSVVSANGFTGTVANPTTTPAVTLATSITGILKGNGTSLAAATAGTDYSSGTSALSTGIVKSTTSTGALTIATAADFPVLNQSTTGNATTASFLSGGAAGQILYQSGTSSTAFVAVGTAGQILISNGVSAPSWVNETPMVYPSSGIGNSTGTAWGTSYSTSGTGTVIALTVSPTFTTPILGTPQSGVATNITGLPLTTGVTGILSGTNGGTGVNNGTKTLTLAGAFSQTLTATGTTNVTLPVTGTLSTLAEAETLTNNRITPRVLAISANSATPAINTNAYDFVDITSQTTALTSFTSGLTGTATNGQKLWIAITGTATVAITWGSSFEASTIALPTTTVGTIRLDIGFIWDAATSKWRCMAVA